MALLAAVGLDSVAVRRPTSVAVLPVGGGLVQSGDVRRIDPSFDASSTMAAAFFVRHRCVVDIAPCPEGVMGFRSALDRLLGAVDLIVTSGQATSDNGGAVANIVQDRGGSWRTLGVKMRPGKPACLGDAGGTTLLALPCNPFAALVTLVLLGLPILAALDGRGYRLGLLPARAQFDLQRMRGGAEFFPARQVDPDSATIGIARLGKGGSSRLRPLAVADGLGYIEADRNAVAIGDPVRFLPFRSVL
jgi:molybdopterin molybdotransferase